MAKALVVSVSVFKSREVHHTQETCHSTKESGLSPEVFACSKHVSFTNRLQSSSLQVRGSLKGPQQHSWGKLMYQWCRPSLGLFTALSEGTSSRSRRHSKRLKRYAKYEDGPVLDWQWTPSSVRNTQLDDEDEGISKVEIVEDDEDDSRDQVLQDQFNLFAMAMALDDDDMAEQAIQQFGNPLKMSEMRKTVDGVTELQEQLQELYEEVNRMIEEGDEDTARALIEANYESLMEQFEPGVYCVEQAAMLDVLAQLRMSLGDFVEVEDLLIQIREVVEKVGINSMQPLVDGILEHVGGMYTALGKPEEGLPFYLSSLEIQEELLGQDSPLIVKTLLGLATTYTDLDENPKAIETYQRVLLILERTRGPNDETLALPLSHLGHSLLEEGRVDEAELSMLRALRIVEKAFGAHDGRVGVATCALARTKAARGEVSESVVLYRKGLQIMEGCSKFPDDDPTMETVRTDLAELLNLLERNDEAEELWEENLRVKEQALGPNDPRLVVHLQNLATAYAAVQKYDKCEPLLRRSLKLVSAHLGPTSPQVSVPLACLATALHHLGNQSEAEPLARQALHTREAAFGPDSPIVGESCNCLASILHSLGRNEEALTLMFRVLAIQEKELGHDSPEIGLTLELLIMLLQDLGRTFEIQPLVHRMQKLLRSQIGKAD
ncbi:unnamed protein product [Sphagnum jensenii]|uniref:Kinesin light chain n=1 Tax=Sphagnum jensenii TaxID=128206 RepID=A0ABP1ARR7_9BRYO